MKPLKPAHLLLLSLLGGAAAMAIPFLAAAPGARNPRGLLIATTAGALLGLLVLGPIALGLHFRSTPQGHLPWPLPHLRAIIPLLMPLSLGYAAAAIHMSAFDAFTLSACLIVSLGAFVGTVLSVNDTPA